VGAGTNHGCTVNTDRNRECHPDVVCDAEHLPFKNKSFTEVVCSHVLEHLEHPECCLREINRVAIEDASVNIGFPLEKNASNCMCHMRVLLLNLFLPSLPNVCLGIIKDLRVLHGDKAYTVWHKWQLTPAFLAKYLQVRKVQRVGSYWNTLLCLKKIRLPTGLRHVLTPCGPKHSYLISCTPGKG